MDTLILTTDGPIATVTLNRPKALNSLDLQMVKDMSEVSMRLESDPNLRCVILCGAGDHFMAGGDIKTFSKSLDDPTPIRKQGFERMIVEAHAFIRCLRSLPVPVIASVRGAVAGYGVSLMSACDLVVAADSSYFTLAYCHIGTSPDGGATYALPRTVGVKMAMEFALLGDRFDADRALELGLVNRVVPLAELDAQTAVLAARLAEGPTAVLGRTKCLINESLGRSLVEQLQAEQDSFAASSICPDFTEGVRAFLEKRKANFSGH